jgi:hypothetical protein
MPFAEGACTCKAVEEGTKYLSATVVYKPINGK